MDAIFASSGGPRAGQGPDRAAEEGSGYPLTDEGRAQIMADIEQIMRDAERRAATDFERQPEGAGRRAHPFPRFREANAAASYTAPSPDGSRPGTFQIPLRPERMTKFGLRTLVYHETVPGHHFQIALEMENDAIPRFRQLRAFGGIPALSEGWGLYAERFAAESGWYEGDLEGGSVSSTARSSARGAWSWTPVCMRSVDPPAGDRLRHRSQRSRALRREPGQACAYMIGQLKIVELRDKARQALGNRFSLARFHTAVLGTGTVPLEILERQIDAYIHGALKAAPSGEIFEHRSRTLSNSSCPA